MKKEEIKKFIETTVEDKTSKKTNLQNILKILFTLIGAYIISYLTVKGENKAMESDIENLTEKIEEIKTKYKKEVEVFKNSQELISSKKKELYLKTEDLNYILIQATNDPSFQKYDDLFNNTVDLLKFIGSNSIFNDLEKERQLIEDNYNSWMENIENTRRQGESKFTLNIEMTLNALDTIQKKLLIQK